MAYDYSAEHPEVGWVGLTKGTSVILVPASRGLEEPGKGEVPRSVCSQRRVPGRGSAESGSHGLRDGNVYTKAWGSWT